MALTNGTITVISKTDTTANLSISTATSGTPPYVSYQWYRSTTSGFTPGAGNIIAGETAQTLLDTGLTPNTTYYYKNIVTDSAPGTATSAESAPVLTAPQQLSQNQFAQTQTVGQLDLAYNYNTKSVMVDSTQATPLFAGMAVKIVTPSGDTAGQNHLPHVVGCAADDDQVDGFINFSIKDQSFGAPGTGILPGSICEVSMTGNVMYLFATANGDAGTAAVLDLTTGGGVAVATGSTGSRKVGQFLDVPAAGFLARVEIASGPLVGLDS